MKRHFDPNEINLWRNPRALAGISRARVASVPINGIRERPDSKHEQQVIIANESSLHKLANTPVGRNPNEKRHGRLVDAVLKKCRFSDNHWLSQDEFFCRLMAFFFASDRDCPAWISIIPQRVTVQHRQDRGFSIKQQASPSKPEAPGHKIWDHRLKLSGLNILCDGLILTPKPGCKIGDTQIVYQTIRRDMMNSSGNLMHRVWEEWCYLATGDEQDIADAASAKVPALRQFFDEQNKIQASAIISLCRLDPSGSQVDLLAFNLNPNDGRAVDFRATIYPFEYYLRSDSNNHTMLRRAITPGCWEYF